MTIVDALKHANSTISNILEKDPIVATEYSDNVLNCSDFLLLLDDYKKVYIRALQIVSLARGYEDNVEGEPFSPDQSILEEI